jgi:hypothetical protein
MNTKETIEALASQIESCGAAWEMIVRQHWITGLYIAIGFGVLFILGCFFIVASSKMRDDEAQGIMGVMSLLVFIISIIGILATGSIAMIVNPEYYAIQDLMNGIGK